MDGAAFRRDGGFFCPLKHHPSHKPMRSIPQILLLAATFGSLTPAFSAEQVNSAPVSSPTPPTASNAVKESVKKFNLALAETKKRIFAQIDKNAVAKELTEKIKKEHPYWGLSKDGTELESIPADDIQKGNVRQPDEVIDKNFIEALKAHSVNTIEIETYANLKAIQNKSISQAVREFVPIF